MSSSQQDTAVPQMIVFGEALFDYIPEKEPILGGAPLNVAWSLVGLGSTPIFVSSVGQDPAGEQAIKVLRDWGIDTSFIYRHPTLSTGSVKVRLENGQPSYEIVSNQAYDQIVLPNKLTDWEKAKRKILYHGTLALRSRTSAETLFKLREASGCEVFVDINLRDPWWDHSIVERSLNKAKWVKLNEEELFLVLGKKQDSVEIDSLTKYAVELRERFNICNVLITLGERGAFFLLEGMDPFHEKAPIPSVVKDTVGAGDGFSAMWLHGISHQMPVRDLAREAVRFACKYCEVDGGTIKDRGFYSYSS